MTGANIKAIAKQKGMESKTVILNPYEEVEYLAITLETFKTAFFLMSNETFEYRYSHTYNAKTDKTTKRTPKAFK